MGSRDLFKGERARLLALLRGGALRTDVPMNGAGLCRLSDLMKKGFPPDLILALAVTDRRRSFLV